MPLRRVPIFRRGASPWGHAARACPQPRTQAAALAAGRAAAGGALASAVPAVPGAGPGDPVDLSRSVPQRRADIIDLHLIHGPLLALLGLIRPLPQPPRDDHPHPPGQRLGHVLRRLPPHIAGQEQTVPVLPLTGLVVPEPRRRRHPELRHRLPRRGEPQFRIVHEVARDRDLGIACCHFSALRNPGALRVSSHPPPDH